MFLQIFCCYNNKEASSFEDISKMLFAILINGDCMVFDLSFVVPTWSGSTTYLFTLL